MPGIHDSPRNFSGAVRTSVALRDRTLPAYPFRPSRLRRSSLIHTPCGSATEKNSSYSDATHTQEGPSGSCRRPRFFGRNRSLHVPCSRIIPNMPTRANRNRNPTNRPTAKEKGPTVFDRQAFPSVGVTGFETATTRPPELNFTFSNKFNELYSSGFYTLSKSCSLPLSGVVAISRVPLVYHAPSAYPIKIEK